MKRLTLFLTRLLLGMMLTMQVMAQNYDLVIKNGRVIDPETEFDAVRNIGIKGDKIAAISESELRGAKTINAKGHVVAPGFIDIHAHGQDLPDHRVQAMQGVTTVLELESGILPIADWYQSQAKKRLPLNYGASVGWTFARIAAFSGEGPEADLGYFQNAQSRDDWKNDLADPLVLGKLLFLVEQGLKEGGLGIGINAGYAPGYGRKEYFVLSELAARYDVPTYTHVRYASIIEPNSNFEAVQELIANATITGAHMLLCHIHSTALKDGEDVWNIVNAAIDNGANISVEAYPYGASGTVIGSAAFGYPGWQEAGGVTPESFQIGDERLTEETFKRYREETPGALTVIHFLDESIPDELALLDVSILNPHTIIASDSLPLQIEKDGRFETYTGDQWPLPEGIFTHPRSTGSYAKILRSYVRERGLLSLNEAIRKMSLLPAQTMDFVPQMRSKGRLQVGMDADIVVFDPKKIADKSTYAEPHRVAVGVLATIVNGTPVVNNGKLVTDASPGRPIRRPGN